MTRTKHIEKRMTQRGISQTMLDLVLTYGEEGPAGRIFLSRKGGSRLFHDLRALGEVVDKGGVEVVVEGETLITAYNYQGRRGH